MQRKDMQIALYTILRKELIRIIRIWPQTIIPPVIAMVLYFIVFGKVVGKHMELIHGVTYINFIIPGLIMNAVIIQSFNNTVSSLFQARFHHSIDEMTVSPMPHLLVIIGYVGGGMMRGLLVGFVVIIIAYLFNSTAIVNPYFTIIVILCSSMLFSILGFINALLARNFDDISWIPNFVLTPLIYLGGVFYPIEILPEFWQKLSLFNPILHIVNAFRYGMIEISSVNPYTALLSLVALNIISFIAAHKMMNMGIGIRK